jgi:hypothetical protein
MNNFHYNNAFNNDSDSLDRLARSYNIKNKNINNSKISSNFNELNNSMLNDGIINESYNYPEGSHNNIYKSSNSISHPYDNYIYNESNALNTMKNELCTGIDCLQNSNDNKYLPQTLNNNFSNYEYENSNNNNNNNMSAIPMMQKSNLSNPQTKRIHSEKYSNQNHIDTFNFNDKVSDFSNFDLNSYNYSNDSSFSEDNLNSFEESLSGNSLISFSPKIKKQLKNKTKHLEHVNDDKSILTHIKNCEQCKKELLLLLKNENTNFFNNEHFTSNNLNNQMNLQNNTTSSIFNFSEVKDIIILILIGIFIIIFIDILFKK